MRKPTPACPLFASEWYSRWPLWSGETFLRTSPSPITSHCMLFSFSSSNLFTCSSFSITLCVAIFTHWVVVLLEPEIINTSAYVGVCSLADSNQRSGHRHPCHWGFGPRLMCYCTAYCFSWPTLLRPRSPMRVGRKHRDVSMSFATFGMSKLRRPTPTCQSCCKP